MSRRRVALFAVAAVLVVLFGGRWLALRYTDYIWFQDLGQDARYRALLLRSMGWQAAVFLAALAWFGAHTIGVYASIGSVHLPRNLGNLEINEAVPPRILRGIALATAAVLAAATAYTFGDLDQYIALARAAEPFGRTDPYLNRDASFYLAVLPLLEVLHLLVTVLAVLSALLSIGLYAVTGSFAVSRRRVRITPHARTHLVIHLAVIGLVVAWGFQIDAWQMIAGGGHQGGALTAIDRSIRIPASRALAVLSLAVAAGSVLALRWVRPMPLFIMWATLGVATLLGRLIVPVVTEAWGGADEHASALVARHTVDYSREGFGLLATPVRPIPAGDVRPESAAALAQALDGIYAWSGQPELPGRILDEAEGDTSAMRLWSVSPAEARDASGRLRPAAIAVAQTDIIHAVRTMPRPRWTPLHRGPLAWGGEAVAISATMRAGRPGFYRSLAPADTAASLTRLAGAPSRVRFLPHLSELGIVGPDEGSPAEPAPGIQLSNMARRLMLGWALQSPPLLDEHTSNADRVLYWRDVRTRLVRLYPFAMGFDPARAAMVDGRLTWLVDVYLASTRFPLAEPVRWRGEQVNYLSAPYVVTLDAVSGVTRLYLRPGASAFEASVARSAQVVPLPADSMPASLRQALRYPEGLLVAQAAMLARRGERDERGRPWSLSWTDTSAASRDAALIRPTIALSAPDGGAVRPWQFVPIVDGQGSRLMALAAGTTNAEGHLELVQLRVEGGTIPTPHAASARILGSPGWVAVSAALGGSENAIRRGPVQAVPGAGTVIYAQLMFNTGSAGVPLRIDGVGALAGSRTGFGSDPQSTARSLLRGEGEPILPASGVAEIAEARAAFLALDSARLSGDWEKFGRAWANLRRVLHLEPAPAPRTSPPAPGPRP